jgi:hypothetical protein
LIRSDCATVDGVFHARLGRPRLSGPNRRV